MENSKLDRCITSLVQDNKVSNQVDLMRLLKKKGFNVPQSTVCRRLNRLKIAKVGGIYRSTEFDPVKAPPVTNLKVSDSGIIVLHTYPGHANSLAYFIDQRYVSFIPDEKKDVGILGTIAGDDTVALIVQGKDFVGAILDELAEEIGLPGIQNR